MQSERHKKKISKETRRERNDIVPASGTKMNTLFSQNSRAIRHRRSSKGAGPWEKNDPARGFSRWNEKWCLHVVDVPSLYGIPCLRMRETFLPPFRALLPAVGACSAKCCSRVSSTAYFFSFLASLIRSAAVLPKLLRFVVLVALFRKNLEQCILLNLRNGVIAAPIITPTPTMRISTIFLRSLWRYRMEIA